jgi:hypothetical protein
MVISQKNIKYGQTDGQITPLYNSLFFMNSIKYGQIQN